MTSTFLKKQETPHKKEKSWTSKDFAYQEQRGQRVQKHLETTSMNEGLPPTSAPIYLTFYTSQNHDVAATLAFGFDSAAIILH